jgi:hydroxymethylbilane synthase
MSSTTIRIATRTSPLALWQAKYMADRLRLTPSAPSVELIHVQTRGDSNQTSPLREFGGTGAFTREVQRAVLNDKADLAVHSLKDLATESVEGLCLACVPDRAPRLDAILLPIDAKPITSLSDLPESARIGTGSPRRQAQLLNQQPAFQVAEIRGNVDTRIRKLDDGEFDAILLAEAGLRRLELQDRISLLLSPPQMLPAVGQGALGIECRVDDVATRELLSLVADVPTLQSVTAERCLLSELRAGCHAPLGAWTEINGRELTLTGVLLSLDGTVRLEATANGNAADGQQIGHDVARQLIAVGGDKLVGAFS